MEQLFKSNTVKQRKIMEWLIAQGITSKDISSAKLVGPALVRITNPGGQYMDVYCNDNHNVRILDIPAEREEGLESCFWNETNDPDTEEWRQDLTEDEAAMIEQWDEATAKGFSKLAQAILQQESNGQRTPKWEGKT